MSRKKDTDLRQKAIQELVKKIVISDQREVTALLKQYYAIEANQAVISRDFRKMGVVKKIVNGVLSYEMPDVDVSVEILRLALVDIDHNETMIVIKTHPGLADFVGDCIDQYEDLEVLGCLAGENVVFVAPKSIKNIHNIYEKVCEKFCFKKKKES